VQISTDKVKELRDQSGAGIMECRNALVKTEGNIQQAIEILKQQSLLKVEKKKTRTASQGLVEAYIHAGGRIGAIIELNCETDFVARTDEFKKLAHELAMQVTAQDPQFVSAEEAPEGVEGGPQAACLLLQPYIRDPSLTIQDIINQTIAKVGENIKVGKFTRFALGE